jgi:hypothetical protein
MTQDEIIEMARDTANHGTHSSGEVIYTFYSEQLLVFAKLVAEKEREACAVMCDALHEARVGKDNYFAFAANAIRELRAKQ